jgi:uncharacterized protein (TIGR03086 family)
MQCRRNVVAIVQDKRRVDEYGRPMTDYTEALEAMLRGAHATIKLVGNDQLSAPTPCAEFDVRGVLNHMCTWLHVFDGSVNERPLDIDPTTYALESGWAESFAASAAGLLAGAREKGFDRTIQMTQNALPGEMVRDMLLMEYITHGIDLAKATGNGHTFTEDQAKIAREAAARIIQPMYRGDAAGMFHDIVEVAPDSNEFDKLFAFLGRDPHWQSPML